ncbi:MAG: hypothetical protein C4B56_04520 [Candidatus Methanophagaceae archaeon]|nr:MAG: hypothetical protein C4B56_04520 [Methanophagales archaeon]
MRENGCPLAKRLTWCKSMRGLKEKRKRKEGRYINNPLGGEKEKMENKKSGKIAMGMAMAAIMLGSIFAMIAPASIAQPPVPTGKDAIYYLEPDNSTVPDYCNTTTVGVWVKSDVPIQNGVVNITYTHCCANITSYTPDLTHFEDQSWAPVAQTPGRLTVIFAHWSGSPPVPTNQPAGVYHLGDFTVHCCDTDGCCVSNLLFDVGTMSLYNVSGPVPFGVDNGTFTCGNPIEVTKYVKNETGAWVKEISKDITEIGTNVTFKTTVHVKCCNLTNLVIWDNMTGLNFSGMVAGPAPNYVSPDNRSVRWNFAGPLPPCNTITLIFNATIVDTGRDCNVQNATGICEETGVVVSDEDEASVIVGAPDLIVTRIDPRYVFESKHNMMTVWVKNVGQNDGFTGNTSLSITGGGGFIAKNTTSLPIAKGEEVEVRMGWWHPTVLENVTLTATADCDDDIDEMDETNNMRNETRNTTGDCIVDDMLPHTCYGYQGQHPMDTVIKGACNRSLIYTTGDYKRGNDTVHFTLPGDLNRITNTTANIPDTATIKLARLYVYYDWYKWKDYGAVPDFGMTFNGNPISVDASYADTKGFTTMDEYQNGMLAFDVTEYVNPGAGVYTANRTIPYAWGKGKTAGMALLIVYEDPSVPHIEYYIDEGADYLATFYYKDSGGHYWQYYVHPDNATTTATFPCIDNPPEEIMNATLFTATLYANPEPPYKPPESKEETLYFNGASKSPVWPTAPNYEIGTDSWNVTSELQANDPCNPEVAEFQERDSYYWAYGRPYGNGFMATNAILIVEKDTKCTATISVEPNATIVQPQDQFDVMINVSSGWPIYGVEYYLTYNTSVVRAETQNKGPFLGNYSDTIVVINDIDQANGKVSYAETRKVDGGVKGEGTVATIQFTAIGARGAVSPLDLLDLDIIIVDEDKQEVCNVCVEDGTVKINDNRPPVPIPTSKHRVNNVAKKYPCITKLCACKSYDPDEGKGGNISYVRWDFGDGQYGTSEGEFIENCTGAECEGCQKEHKYESWQWEPWGVPYNEGGHYVPFNATLTLTDDGCPEETNSSFLDVTVYIAGDANGDGRVNILDAVWVGKHWGKRCDDPGYPEPGRCCYYWTGDREQQDGADLNNDCVINILDAVIIGANWGHVAW